MHKSNFFPPQKWEKLIAYLYVIVMLGVGKKYSTIELTII